jgi:hypothetical protein
VVRASAESEHEGQNDNANDNNDFECRQPEFELAEEFDAKVVDADNDDPKHCNKYAGVDIITVDPVLYDQSSGSKLIRSYDDVLEPVSAILSVREQVCGSVDTHVYPRANPRAGSQKRTAYPVNPEDSGSQAAISPKAHITR